MSSKKARGFSGDVAINLIFALVPIAITLITVPLYIAQIGLERYGILSLVWMLTGMFAFFDFGMGTATNYLVARAQSGASDIAAGVAVRTTALVNCGLGLILAVVFLFAIGPLAFGNIDGSPELLAEIDLALPWMAVVLPVGLLASIFRNTLDGQRRFFTVNLIQTGGQAGAVLSALAVAYLVSPDLTNLIIAILVVRLVVLIAFFLSIWEIWRGGSLMTRQQFKSTIKFGGWQTLFSGLSGMVSSADRFVIGWIAGAAATALYAVPYSFTSRLQFVTQAVMRSLFPKLAAAETDDQRRELGQRALWAVMAVMAAVTVPAILFVRPFFRVWIGPEFDDSAGQIAQVLLVAFYLQACLRVMFIFLRAAGQPDIPAKVRSVSALPFLAVLVGLTWAFGAFGAAFALLLQFAAELVWMLKKVGFLRKIFGPLIGFLGACAAAALISQLNYGIWLGASVAGLVAIGMMGVGARVSEDVANLLRRVLPLGKVIKGAR